MPRPAVGRPILHNFLLPKKPKMHKNKCYLHVQFDVQAHRGKMLHYNYLCFRGRAHGSRDLHLIAQKTAVNISFLLVFALKGTWFYTPVTRRDRVISTLKPKVGDEIGQKRRVFER